MRIAKIFIIGAGNVGSAAAAAMAARRLGQIYLYDIIEDLAIGKAMDINHASPYFHSDSRVTGCNSLEALSDADVVALAAGAPRRAGMTRKDLLAENLQALLPAGEQIMARCPKAKVLMVTNPVDILTGLFQDRWREMNIMGLGCSLDTLRFRFFLAEAARASVDSVSALVIGSHDDNMIPLTQHATIGGVRIEQFLDAARIAKIVNQTRQAGTTIVGKLKTRGSFYAASYAIAEIVEAVVRDTQGIFPLSVRCRGHYGYDETTLALPCLVGNDGVETILQIDLDAREQAALDVCAAGVAAAMAGAG